MKTFPQWLAGRNILWSVVQVVCGVLVALPVLRSPAPITPGQRLAGLVLVLASTLFVWVGVRSLIVRTWRRDCF